MCHRINPRVAALQESLLDGIKRQYPGTRDYDIAEVAGVDRSMVAHWRAGSREMSLGQLRSLLREYSAPIVLESFAAIDGSRIVRAEPERTDDLESESHELSEESARLAHRVHEALRDHRISSEEAGELRGLLRQLSLHLDRITATVPGE